MAEIKMESGLVGENARVVDNEDDRDNLSAALDQGKPRDDLADLTDWVMGRVKQWRNHRRENYELQWDGYERLWRGLWSGEDKNRKSEKSKLVTPALAEAVENIVAEVEEAVFGRGDLFDMTGEMDDTPDAKDITDKNKARLKEDLARTDFSCHIGEALINAAVYGTGIGEVVVQSHKLREIQSGINAMLAQPDVAPAMQVISKDVTFAHLQSVNPRNFLIDPIARSIDAALGCAIEEYVGSHIIRAGQKKGDYRDVEIGTDAGDTELGADRQVENEYVHDKVHIVRYYGLVPEHLLFPKGETVELFPGDEAEPAPEDAQVAAEIEQMFAEASPKTTGGNSNNVTTAVSGEEKSEDPIDSDMIEAIVVIANDGVCIKAVKTPFVMEDRPVVAFPWDVVPGRFWGRGVCEKGEVPQRVMDAEMRARIDALAYVSAPMMAMDASKLPRGFTLTVKPGKSILTNGDPKNILNPLHFGTLDQSTFVHSQQLDQMVQRATGSLDVIALASKAGGDSRPGAVSMMLSGIVKRHKRTLMGFLDRFYIPSLRKIMWRNMQFYSSRYVPLNWTFNASSTIGILQREYETQQLVSLMQTMDPQSKEYKLLLMAVVENTGLTRRREYIKMIQQSIENAVATENVQTQQNVDPIQQQLAAAAGQLQLAELNAKIAELNSRARLQDAKTQNEVLEPKFKALDVATKGIYQVAQNQQNTVFDQRLKLADRALKLEDIKSNERIAAMQTTGSVKSDTIKSVGALASEKVRQRGSVVTEHVRGVHQHAAERVKGISQTAGHVAKARGHVAAAHVKAKADAAFVPSNQPLPVNSQAQVLDTVE